MGDTRSMKYWAFISYSHQEKAWAQRVHRSLETYRVPRRLTGLPGRDGVIPRRIYPVFRDREELPTSSDLGAAISEALQASRTLIVICSRTSASSIWVNEEVRTFKRLGRAGRIMCLIVDGEPNATDRGRPGDECFCPALRHEVDAMGAILAARVEPLAADARAQGDGAPVAMLKLKAGVLGVDFDQLARRERRRRMTRAASGALAIAVALVLGWALRWKVLELQSLEAASRAEELIREDRNDEALLTLLPAMPTGGPGLFSRPLVPEAEAALDLALQRNRLHAVLGGVQYETEAGEFSPDGKALVTSSRDGTVRVWDPETGRQTHCFFEARAVPETTGRTAVFHPDGSRVATGTADGRVVIFPLAGGAPVTLIHGMGGERPGNGNVVHLLAFSKDGKLLLSGGWNGLVRLWDWKAGKLIATFTHPARVLGLGFDAAHGRIATLAADGCLRFWNPAGGPAVVTVPVGTPSGQTARFGCLALAPGGARLAASLERHLCLLDLSDPSHARVIARLEHDDDIRWLDFDARGQRLLTASEDGTAKMLEAATGLERFSVTQQAAIRRAIFAPDGASFATISIDRTGQIWDASNGRPLEGMKLRGQRHFLLHAAYSPDGRWLLTTSSDMSLRLWEIHPPSRTVVLQGHRHEVRGAAFAPDGTSVWTTGLDRRLLRFDARTGKLLQELPSGHEDYVYSLAVDPSGTRIATASRDGTVRILNLAGGKAQVLRGHEAAVVDVTFDPGGRRLASTSRDGSIRVWDAGSGKALPFPPMTHQDPNKPIWHVVFSPDGQRLLSVSHDGTAAIWDSGNGRRVRMLSPEPDPHWWSRLWPSPRKPLSAMTWGEFSPDGREVATGSEDGLVRIWDVASGRQVGNPLRHADQVRALVFHPKGDLLITATLDGTLSYWTLPSGQLIAKRFVHDGRAITCLAIDRTGAWLATASADRTARVLSSHVDGRATVEDALQAARRLVP